MSDDTTPQDSAAMSPASTGSVDSPVAWAALREDGDIAWIGYTPDGAADGACGRRIVPLYTQQQPTLTDTERSLLEMLADHPVTHEIMPGEVATLRGLLDRLS